MFQCHQWQFACAQNIVQILKTNLEWILLVLCCWVKCKLVAYGMVSILTVPYVYYHNVNVPVNKNA